MVLGQELINDNGISAIALAFFTALFGMVGTIIVTIYKDRRERREAQQAATEAALKAASSAEKVEANTKNISNGFAGKVLGELSQIRAGQNDLQQQFADHLRWHLEREGQR
jgi:cation transport regulator ChaB